MTDTLQVVIDDIDNNLKNSVVTSNLAKDMIVRSLKMGDMKMKYSQGDIIKFLEGCRFRLETENENGEMTHNLVFKIPEKEK